MQLISLKLKDFLSYDEIEYEFERGKPVCIQGRNKFRKGQESNGSGKSALQSGVEYALMRTTSRGVRDVSLVRRGRSKAEIVLNIYCPVREQTLTISRTILTKGSSTAELHINDKPVEFATVKDADDMVFEWLGMPKADIPNYYITNKKRYVSFFDTSNNKKLELIGRLYDFSTIDRGVERLESEIKEREVEVSNIENNQIKLQGKLESYQESVAEAESGDDDFEERKVERIEKVKSQITSLEEENGVIKLRKPELEKEITDITNKITVLSEEVSTLKESIKGVKLVDYTKEKQSITGEIEEVEEEIKEFDAVKEEFNLTVKTYDEGLKAIELSLMGKVECPKCKYEFIPGEVELSVEELKEQKEEYEKSKSSIEKDLKELSEGVEELESFIEEKKNSKRELSQKEDEENEELRKKIKGLKENIFSIESNIANLESDVHKKQKQIKDDKENLESNLEDIELKRDQIKRIKEEKPNTSTIDTLKRQIEDVKLVMKEGVDKLEDKSKKLENLKEWKFNLRKFKMFISNRVLQGVQNKVNDCLERMDSELMLKLEGFKQLANGDLKEEITPYIIDEGEIVDINSLSGGELGRVDIATIIAIQEIINEMNKWGGLDLIWIDEVLESVDGLGVYNIMKSLESLNKTILLTTHVNIMELYDNYLLIENLGGVSRIIKK